MSLTDETSNINIILGIAVNLNVKNEDQDLKNDIASIQVRMPLDIPQQKNPTSVFIVKGVKG